MIDTFVAKFDNYIVKLGDCFSSPYILFVNSNSQIYYIHLGQAALPSQRRSCTDGRSFKLRLRIPALD